jgi:hypothetical protein
MASAKTIAIIKNSINNYNAAVSMYEEITKGMEEMETADSNRKEFLVDKVISDARELSKYMNRINMSIIISNYPEETVDILKSNMEKFKETVWYAERSSLGSRLYDAAIDNVENLVGKAGIGAYDMYDYATSETEFAKKMCSTMTDPKYVMDQRNNLQRIISGKMTPQEFNSLFNAIKSKMIPRRLTNESFESIANYKKSKV